MTEVKIIFLGSSPTEIDQQKDFLLFGAAYIEV